MALKRSEEGEKNKRRWKREEDGGGSGSEAKKTGLYASRPVFFFPNPLNPFLCPIPSLSIAPANQTKKKEADENCSPLVVSIFL